jgi:triosephosphate isomerase
MSASSRKKFIAANWKMHKTSAEAIELTTAILRGMPDSDQVRVAIFPPFPYLSIVAETLHGSQIALGAQNLYPSKEGAFTGEVSPTMLLDVGCKFVILGHSERRHLLGESDLFINEKVKLALKVGLHAILCIGETLDQRNLNQTDVVLEGQLIDGLDGVPSEALDRLTIAYEPIWAIGNTGHSASPIQAEASHSTIRRQMGRLFGEEAARKIRILYGGSVKPENVAALLEQPDIDGALIGGAGLVAEEFLAIVRAGIRERQAAGR